MSKTESTALAETPTQISAYESWLVQGDLGKMPSEQRLEAYNATCASLGLNPLTRPFGYIDFKGKLTFYAKKECAEQLRGLRNISIKVVYQETTPDGVRVVRASATMPDGRTDEDEGVVFVGNAKGEDLANLYMKAITKAKRRVTLSICGLGFLDESELETTSAVVVSQPQAEPQAHATPARITRQQIGQQVLAQAERTTPRKTNVQYILECEARLIDAGLCDGGELDDALTTQFQETFGDVENWPRDRVKAACIAFKEAAEKARPVAAG